MSPGYENPMVRADGLNVLDIVREASYVASLYSTIVDSVFSDESSQLSLIL